MFHSSLIHIGQLRNITFNIVLFCLTCLHVHVNAAHPRIDILQISAVLMDTNTDTLPCIFYGYALHCALI